MNNDAVISEFRPKVQSCKPERRRLHERMSATIRRALKGISNRVAEARHAQQLFDKLNAMNDHELEDMGILRSDIRAIVAGTYRGIRPPASNVIPLDRRCRTRSAHLAAAFPQKPSAA